MEIGQFGLGDDVAGVFEHFIVFGREAGDDIGAEHHVGAERPEPRHYVKRLGAAVPALHAL